MPILQGGWDCLAVDIDGRFICKFLRHTEAEAAPGARGRAANALPPVDILR